MDSDKRSAQVGRLEVVETGRRRRWSEDEKLKIVLESLQAPRRVTATARRYGILRSLLLRWRRSFHPEPTDPTGRSKSFYFILRSREGWVGLDVCCRKKGRSGETRAPFSRKKSV
jgi:transposase-like protein